MGFAHYWFGFTVGLIAGELDKRYYYNLSNQFRYKSNMIEEQNKKK